MTCDEARPILQIYLDDELAPLDAQRVNEHLRACPRCSRELGAYRRVDALLAEAVTVGAQDTEALRARVVAETARARRMLGPAWALAAAAMLAVAAAVAVVWLATRPSAPTALDREAVAEHQRAVASAAGMVTATPELALLVARFTGGRPVAVDVAGLRVVGGHACHLGETGYAHVVYATADGRTISVYVCRSDAPSRPPAEATVDHNVVATTDADGLRRVAVGDAASRADVLRALDAVR